MCACVCACVSVVVCVCVCFCVCVSVVVCVSLVVCVLCGICVCVLVGQETGRKEKAWFATALWKIPGHLAKMKIQTPQKRPGAHAGGINHREGQWRSNNGWGGKLSRIWRLGLLGSVPICSAKGPNTCEVGREIPRRVMAAPEVDRAGPKVRGPGPAFRGSFV